MQSQRPCRRLWCAKHSHHEGDDSELLFGWWPLAVWCLLTCHRPTFSHCLGPRLLVMTDFLCRSFMYVQTDYYYEYTECDSTGSRWRVAIPQKPGSCTGLPEPVHGTECSKYVWECVCVQERLMCVALLLISSLEFSTPQPDKPCLVIFQTTAEPNYGSTTWERNIVT